MKPIGPLTLEQKQTIDQMVSEGAPTLFLPRSLFEASRPERSGLPDGTQVIVPPTYADISGKPSSARDLFADLQTADLTIAVYELASLNVLLDSSAKDGAFQSEAVARYVRPEFRKLTTSNPSAPSPSYEFILNGLGTMIALKGVMGVERPIGPMMPSPFKTGDLILRANQFVSGTRFDGTVRQQSDADLAAETICTWDLTNPRHLGYEPARIMRMLELIDAPDENVSTLRDKLGIATSELRFAGLPIIDFLAVVFGIVASMRSLPSDAVLANPRAATIDSRTLLTNVNLPQSVLETFLARRSISLADLRNRLTANNPWTADEYSSQMESSKFRTDFLVFRQFPLIAISETEFIISNLQFLTELMFSGLYFELYLSFPSKTRDVFFSLWGRLFELSICEMLGHFYPPFSGLLRTNVEFPGGEADAMLDFGDYVVIFEFKHFLLTHDVKYSRSGTLLENALRERLFANQGGDPKAIQQLIKSTTAVRSGEITTLRGRTNTISEAAPVFPVIVVADPALEAPFVNVFCNGLFQAEAADLDVQPLTMMSVHEFEETMPFIASGQLTWRELLNSRFHRKTVRPTSIHQACYLLSQEKGLEYVRNVFRQAQFAQIFEKIRQRYAGNAVGDDVPPNGPSASC